MRHPHTNRWAILRTPARPAMKPTRAAVYLALADRPGITLTEVAAIVGKSVTTVWEHAVRLERDGYVVHRGYGPGRRYMVTEEAT